ncbi:alpha/beta hydrolase [Methylocapsa sp. S129]|uniref:alpha/beta hydrolase n=1 Tax=Methylocapsa sp. S129 TaxID=1641869 RepID=UPI00131D6B58|nr:alpha/beta hydrolase [Methylocapsa sp. S129]
MGTRKAATLIVGILLGLSAAPAQMPPEDAAVWLVADRRLTVYTPAGSGALALYVSQDWNRPQPAVTRAIVTIHGIERAADFSRTIAEAARAASKLDPESVLLIEPQFLNDGDVAAQHLPAETLHWAHANWEGGDDARGPAPISSFAALDAILARLADRGLFPALKDVVVAGHSGGGQLVQRYAVASRGEGALAKAGIHLRYIVANPSSYVYFSPERPAGDGLAPFDAAACPIYDRWKYGMTGLPPYLAGQDAAALEAAYVGRDVIYLLGAADDNPNHPELDKTCMAEAEGPNRYARGLAYFRYLQRRHPTSLSHRLLQVPDVGHNDDIFNSACGLAALYDLRGCAGD